MKSYAHIALTTIAISGIMVVTIGGIILKIINERLRSLREGVKLSQAKIGEMIGTTQSSVNRFESTMTAPILTTLLWYADFFDVSLDYIFGRTDNPQGKLYEYLPKIIENDSEMRRFIEMCFEPNSPMNERLRQTLIDMLGEAKE